MADDGSRVLFLRSASGDDPVNALWLFDPANREESLVVDPEELLAGTDPGRRARSTRAGA